MGKHSRKWSKIHTSEPILKARKNALELILWIFRESRKAVGLGRIMRS